MELSLPILSVEFARLCNTSIYSIRIPSIYLGLIHSFWLILEVSYMPHLILNPNAISGAHDYTTDKYENDTLVSLRWRAEDIAWYALEK